MTHLTDQQIDELLMGSLDPAEAAELRAHAAACDACAQKLAELEAPLASFKAVTLAWSERRSATLPVRPAPRSKARWGMALAWGSLAAAALLATLIPVLRHEQSVRVEQAYHNATKPQGAAQTSTAMQPANTAAAPDDSVAAVPENPQEIASDNRMLAMVDEELNAPIVAPRSPGPGHSRANPKDLIPD